MRSPHTGDFVELCRIDRLGAAFAQEKCGTVARTRPVAGARFRVGFRMCFGGVFEGTHGQQSGAALFDVAVEFDLIAAWWKVSAPACGRCATAGESDQEERNKGAQVYASKRKAVPIQVNLGT